MRGENTWLTYKTCKCADNAMYFQSVAIETEEMAARTAVRELKRAAWEMFELDMKEETGDKAGIILRLDSGFMPDTEAESETGQDYQRVQEIHSWQREEGYRITVRGHQVTIRSAGARGLLYGSFALIRQVQMERPLKALSLLEIPSNPIRILNHWDNMDGSIERGYSGNSFFFQNQEVLVNGRTRAYARMIASVGINAAVINNVNVRGNATKLIDETYGEVLKRLSEVLAEYGVKLYLSLNFAAPMELGGLDSADPVEEKVKQWWKEKMADVFTRIPNLGGFLVKADSEGRPGPFTYGRTHADGANTLAEAVKPYGGLIIWRCFVYNCQQDWRDKKTDRARSGYDCFKPLDGTFQENVILQIKNGPMDFQVREPVSPLLGGLTKTNQILEVQIAQEYTGQQRHVCYLIPMFKEVLEFHTYCTETQPAQDRVADIVSGRTFGQINCGMAAVANTGADENWTGHDLAAANLYGFGRLSFHTELTAEEIACEWAACTFGTDPEVLNVIVKILMMSWPAYENYTSPLGIGWMVNPNHHYGPNVNGYEYDRWGTYHRADHEGLGVDRSRDGTGYAGQYRENNASVYGQIETCPDELLLFFHHVPYTHRLKSGKTVIQHIYDTHFEGAGEVEEIAAAWDSIRDRIVPEVYERVRTRLEHQMEHSKEWRDQINTYFYRISMIPDEKGRRIY